MVNFIQTGKHLFLGDEQDGYTPKYTTSTKNHSNLRQAYTLKPLKVSKQTMQCRRVFEAGEPAGNALLQNSRSNKQANELVF
jgi:hypothetical protein